MNKHKPTVQHIMDLARNFRAAPGDLYDAVYKALETRVYGALAEAIEGASEEQLGKQVWFDRKDVKRIIANLTRPTADPQRYFAPEFEVWQDDCMVAGSCGPSDEALAEAMRYAEQYRQDGSVNVFEVCRELVAILPSARKEGAL